MIAAAKLYILIFGAITIAGGLIGYLGAGSTISLVMGVVAGIILLVGGFLISPDGPAGLWISLIASALLAGRFLPALIKNGVEIAEDATPLRMVGAYIVAAMGPLGVIGAFLAAAALFLKK